jgi:hypothetical protein
MKTSLILSAAVSTLLLGTSALAQNRPVTGTPDRGKSTLKTPNEAVLPQTPIHPSRVAADDPPLVLRDGAVPTGLYGYYDYQSNGMSPGWLRVEKGNPQKVHAVYMLSTDKGEDDTLQVSANRRVGYAFSNDGGKTWTANREIEQGVRLGFPYLQVAADGTPMIIAHGDPSGQNKVHSIFYLGNAGTTEFTRLGEFPLATGGGRIGDQGTGVIWPAFVINPKDPTKGVFIASFSRPSGELEVPPLQYQVSALGDAGPWKNMPDSTETSGGGGNYVIATSPGGKIGIALQNLSFKSATELDWSIQGIYYLESTDGGNSWSTPVKAFGQIPGELGQITPGGNLDLAFLGEEPHIVASGSDSTLFAGQGIWHWSPSTGLTEIQKTDPTMGIGAATAALAVLQPNMNLIDYPTIATGDDGQHLTVTFQAVSQTVSQPSDAVVSSNNFHYYRLWTIGSPDGGKHWGTPFITQDFAGDGTDSASIEYPSADEVLRKVGSNYELSLAFQARREPGMYAFIIADIDGNGTPANRGPFSETFQYFQRKSLTENDFKIATVSVPTAKTGPSMTLGNFFPNPASSVATVQFSVPSTGEVTLRVYNSLGSEVMQPISGEQAFAGTYSRAIDVSTLPAGPYRVVLSYNGQTVSQPLKVVR